MPSYQFLMPDIGEGVVEGEVISWLKKPGDSVKKDEAVLVLMTDKATVELPSPYAGTLIKQCYKEGAIAKKGTPLYELETSQVSTAVQQPKVTFPEEEKVKPVSPSTAVLAAPPVRRIAKELGIPLDKVKGSGPDGRVLRQDLAAYAPVYLEGDSEQPLIGIKHLMAEKMALSHKEIPPFSYFDQADATRLIKLQEKFAEQGKKESLHVTFMPFFIRALSLIITQFPVINSSFNSDKLIQHSAHNIGIAMDTPYGLIVPVLKHVETLSLQEIVHAYEELKTKAKQNKLTSSEMKEGTITITNFGALSGGGLFATPIINYPEAAILGVARIHKEPAEYHGEVVLRDLLHLSWSFDHRIIDGSLAAQVSKAFVTLIENPASLI